MQCCFLQALQHVHFQDLPEDFPTCLILRSVSLLLNVIKLLSKKPSWTHPHWPNEEGVFNFDSISRWCSCIHRSSLCVCTQVRGGYLMKLSGNRRVLWLNVVELTCSPAPPTLWSVCAQDLRAMPLSTKSPFSMIIYNLNLPVYTNLAETRSAHDYNFIPFNFSPTILLPAPVRHPEKSSLGE